MAATAACDNERAGREIGPGAGLNDAAAHGSAAMTIPYYISEDKSDMRGIKPGWYGMEDDGNLSTETSVRRRFMGSSRTNHCLPS
jgi:hypothetical protein